jgi:hypothetical protein
MDMDKLWLSPDPAVDIQRVADAVIFIQMKIG